MPRVPKNISIPKTNTISHIGYIIAQFFSHTSLKFNKYIHTYVYIPLLLSADAGITCLAGETKNSLASIGFGRVTW